MTPSAGSADASAEGRPQAASGPGAGPARPIEPVGDGRGQRLSRPRLREWLRHHASSLAATAVDFLVMIACVQFGRVNPVAGTVAGATAGAVTNFLLGRHWTYRRGDEAVAGQAARYALVSGASLGLNALGEHLLANVLGIQYILARVLTAFAVSNLWNYPLQKLFVFRR